MTKPTSRLPIIAVVGPTASGKTHKAVGLAKHINAEIISCDSRQIYRGMDIGTGKDLDEYGKVPYHLIDIRPAGYKYNLCEFLHDYSKARDDIYARNKNLILCGGSGLYVESILSGLQLPPVPENPQLRTSLKGKSISELKDILLSLKTLHNTTDLDTAQRAIRAIEIQTYYAANPDILSLTRRDTSKHIPSIIVALEIPREERRKRISERLTARLQEGMVEEIQGLLNNGLTSEELIYYGLEYKFVSLYINGILTYDEMFSQLEIAIHQFAKRQMTWFRGMERRGFKLHWIPYNMPQQEFNDAVLQLLQQ